MTDDALATAWNDVNARIDEGYAPCGGVAFLNSQPYQAMVLQP